MNDIIENHSITIGLIVIICAGIGRVMGVL